MRALVLPHATRTFLVALTSVLLAQPLASQDRSEAAPQFFPPCNRSHDLHSQITGRWYPIDVALPPAYCTARDTARYPVLYLLDQESQAAAAYRRVRSAISQTKDTLIMVGIGWDTTVPNARLLDYFAPAAAAWDDLERVAPADQAEHARSRAFTAQVRDTVLRGRPAEAQLFLRVVREEILPMIDRLYRTTADRGLFGHSAGGWFTTYAMLEAPDLFNRFAIASPGYAWDDFRIFQLEAEYAKSHTTLPKTVVMTVAANEGFMEWSDVYRFADVLRWGRRYSGLKISVRVVPGDHASVQDLWTMLDELYPLKR